ncbi:MAG TPA: Uma2 family endonuclease [Thermoanaerobaculia bacterium]|nr:Uma2 family endonuclease [Thermoanaerobaculia bacterium]
MALRDPVRRKLTYKDYLLFPEDGNRHEILDGEHYVSAAPSPRHQRIVVQMTWWIESHLRQQRLGSLYVAPIDILLAVHDIVQPDLLFISNASMKILTEKNVQGPPDLVIEILSDSTRKRDEGIKLERYDLLGVEEYWVVDPKREAARIYRRSGEHLQQAAELTAAARDLLTSPFFPGLEIPLFEIFL